jgi:hypothetical protein
MPQDHSSRWSAAASPGGLIGLALTILALMALTASALSLTDLFDLGLEDTVSMVALGVSVFLTVLLVYLLIAYVTISYSLDANGLRIRCGVWSATIPFDEMEAVGPTTDALGDQDSGWQPYWPGYYVGVRKTDLGKVRIIATQPLRRQIAITRFDGETFSISPERPLLFMEELARWHEAYLEALESDDPEKTAERPAVVQAFPLQSEQAGLDDDTEAAQFVHVQTELPSELEQSPASSHEPLSPERDAIPHHEAPVFEQPESDSQYVQDEIATSEHPAAVQSEPPSESRESAPESSLSAEPQDVPSAPAFGTPQPDLIEPQAPGTELPHEHEQRVEEPEQPARETAVEPGPVFGTASPADEHPSPAPRFGFTPPEVEPSYLPADAQPENAVPADGIPTNQFEVWFPAQPDDEPEPVESPRQIGDPDVPAVHEDVSQTPAVATEAEFSAPPPVILPAGTPRREVIQPLTRVQRAEVQATSPALRPMLHRDPVSLGFIGFGLVAGIAMAGYIFLQYDDIPPSLTLHWNAEGMPGRIGEPREVWILPLIAAIVLLANVGLAWSIAQFDRFAARLTLSSTVITHIVLWIALLMIL